MAYLYFLCFWAVFLFFYAGSYNYGADVRFSLLTYPAVAILAGAGASVVHDVATRNSAPGRHVAAGVCAVLCMQFLWYLPHVRASGEEAWAARADVDFVHEVTRMLPRNSYVLTHNPSLFLLRGVNAGQMSGSPDIKVGRSPGRSDQELCDLGRNRLIHGFFWDLPEQYFLASVDGRLRRPRSGWGACSAAAKSRRKVFNL